MQRMQEYIVLGARVLRHLIKSPFRRNNEVTLPEGEPRLLLL